MDTADPRFDRLKTEWTDKLVTVSADRADLARFAGLVGRVVTVNFNAKAIVDFADGAWYDIDPAFLVPVTDSDARAKYDATANSAQPFPTKQS
ncbi:MAG: hypothetical protein EBV06_01005 [Planctomycetia bacterium]|nr:hypothetical protein [Planctomycetia bacterium]